MRFPIDSSKPLVADASVIINLNATLCASEVIGALANPLFVTENARIELEAGLRNGHVDAQKLRVLIEENVVRIAHLGAAGVSIYEALIEGDAETTLDDGEAATIASACEINGIAIIDERKARSLCAARFPKLDICSSAELLISEVVGQTLGSEAQISAILNALRGGRMRVPQEHVASVVKLIGEENAASCTSLPKSAKRTLASRKTSLGS